MQSPCRIYTFTNIQSKEDIFSNIARCASENGWVIDKTDNINNELYLHSLGNGQQNIYYSLKFIHGYAEDQDKYALYAHGNTGFDASQSWDNQPGRFTEIIYQGYMAGRTYFPIFRRHTNHASFAWWVIPPVQEMVILINNHVIIIIQRLTYTFTDQHRPIQFSGWIPFMVGCCDGLYENTQLNTVINSGWSGMGVLGSMLSLLPMIPSTCNSVNTGTTCVLLSGTSVGMLYQDKNIDILPSLQKTSTPNGYTDEIPESIVRTSILSTTFIAVDSTYIGCVVKYSLINERNEFNYSYKGILNNSGVIYYDSAVFQNPSTLRYLLVKPLIYKCSDNNQEIIGELPYYAVNMTGLKGKDIIRIGGKSFMVFPNASDTDTIGIAIEVQE